jgi:serine/threonine protein kinase
MHQFTQMPKNHYTVKLLDLFIVQEDKKNMGVFVVMEHMESDLKKLLNSSQDLELGEDNILVLVYNIIRALKFIHSANVMHRDIKPANILFDADCNIKICDFGLARSLPESLVGKGSNNSKRTRDSIMKG